MEHGSLTISFTNNQAEEAYVVELMAEKGLIDSRLRLMMKRYYAACHETMYDSRTVVVRDAAGPILLMPMVMYEKKLSYFNQPAAPVYLARLEEMERCEAYSAACSFIVGYCKKAGVGLSIARPSSRIHADGLEDWEVKLLQAGGRQIQNYHGYVVLDSGEVSLYRQMRRSYRSLVNWGRREMRITFLDSNYADPDLFESFRLFHLEIAGRVTRPIASWAVMFDLIIQGKAILGLGFLGNDLVAATYFFCHDGLAIYGTGVYERGLFDKPISHWPLFATMSRAAECGARLCDLGIVFTRPQASAKERNIAFFKKGFTDFVIDDAYWDLCPMAH